ncbi:MAG: hypothetical protein H6R26_2835 [Proteobacteria bacterium]|nr:hypothetical protein [Pseudomonadota bacterium]
MKWLVATATIIAALGLLAYTNPSLKHYDQFVNRVLMEQVRKQKSPLANALGSLFSGITSNIVAQQTMRKDYLFFSTYETVVGKERMKAVGVLNDFIVTEQPSFKRGD